MDSVETVKKTCTEQKDKSEEPEAVADTASATQHPAVVQKEEAPPRVAVGPLEVHNVSTLYLLLLTGLQANAPLKVAIPPPKNGSGSQRVSRNKAPESSVPGAKIG